MNKQNTLLGLIALFALAGSAVAETNEVSLSKDIMPLIARSCTGCHQRENGNQKAIENGPYLEKKSDVMAVVGTLIVPGKPESSYLLMTMSPPAPGKPQPNIMPPKRSKAPRMTAAELAKIASWIKDGAKHN